MNFQHEWVTPIGEINLRVPEEMRKRLMQSIAYACKRPTASQSLFEERYNINPDTLMDYEKIFNELIKYYLSNGYGIHNANEELRIDARAYGFNTPSLTNGGYNKPTRYPEGGFDGVLVYCASPGGEFYLDNDHYPEEIENPVSYTSDYTIQNPIINQNNVDKKWSIYNMKKGDVIIYPAYCWGGSNAFIGVGVQSHLYINYRAITTATHGRNTDTRKEHSFPSF